MCLPCLWLGWGSGFLFQIFGVRSGARYPKPTLVLSFQLTMVLRSLVNRRLWFWISWSYILWLACLLWGQWAEIEVWGWWRWRFVRWGFAYSVPAKPVRSVGYFFSLCFASYFRVSSSRISILLWFVGLIVLLSIGSFSSIHLVVFCVPLLAMFCSDVVTPLVVAHARAHTHIDLELSFL